jgi:hypothetical protein
MASGRRARLRRLRQLFIAKRKRAPVQIVLKDFAGPAKVPAPDPEPQETRTCLCGQVNPPSRFECMTCGRHLEGRS